MFTGIIQGKYEIVDLNRKTDFLSFAVKFDDTIMEGLKPGSSVAIDGICQTVCAIKGSVIWFDAMAETLKKTTLSDLRKGDHVNVERSTKAGQEIGGHDVSGHVDGVLEIIKIEESEDNFIFTLRYPGEYSKYIFDKGFLSVHGASLTVSYLDKEACIFEVYLIPETLRLTNLGERKTGDHLNFEVDRRTQAIVATVEKFLAENIDSIRQSLSS